ncbi:classical arabinogalactan protein 1 [Brassica rapa]|uniref:Arabinogalactan protein n=2 Tax=Brassica TaxID=3705 RepID=M4E680_BRACM|nr:classical arabinogalactan protein 1 [Brassica rapa]CAF2087887.1 unnamed protein product [Brassica napus]CDY43807.1 BnaA06g23430D [Brassica napus]
MALSKFLGFILLAAFFVSFTVAQSPAPAPSSGGRRISPAHSPKKAMSPAPAVSPTPQTALTPESSSSPPSPPSADSPSDLPAFSPSSISNSPAQAPAPVSGTVSNSYAVFGSVAFMLTAAVLAM